MEENGKVVQKVKFCCPPKDILKPVMEVTTNTVLKFTILL